MSNLEMLTNTFEKFTKHQIHTDEYADDEEENVDYDDEEEEEDDDEESFTEQQEQHDDDDNEIYEKIDPLEDDDDDIIIIEGQQNQQEFQQKQQHHQVEEIINESLNVLNLEQVKKLDNLLNHSIPIHGQGNFPTLNVTLKDFIRNLNRKLSSNSVFVKDIRINGGVASHILTNMNDHQYSDIDIIFYCTLIDEKVNNFDKIKQCVFDCLLDYLPPQAKKDKISSIHLKEAYVMKMVKVADNDIWSLISLRNNDGQNIELKFVNKMRRQFQFSVDSFQIHLNSLLSYYDCTDYSQTAAVKTDDNNQEITTETAKTTTLCNFNQNFYPKVIAESVYGNFNDAKYHLDNKLIATKSPEEIRGGGLLKYCNLIVRGYTPADEYVMKNQEKYMCSRFFIDFNDIESQKYMLLTFIHTHFKTDLYLRCNYLIKLFEIVSKSTVCLMNHERRLTLELISQLADSCQTQIYWHEQQNQPQQSQQQQQQQQLLQQQQQQHYYYYNNQNRKNRYPSVSSTSSNSSSTSSTSSSHSNNNNNNNNNRRRFNNNNNNRQYNNRNNYNNNYYHQHQHTGSNNQNNNNYVYFNDFNAYYNHQTNTIPQTFTISNRLLITNPNCDSYELATATTLNGATTPIIITRPTTLLTTINNNNNNDQHATPSSSSSSSITTTNTSLLHSTNSSIVSTPLISPSESPSPAATISQQQAINNVNMNTCKLQTTTTTTTNNNNDIYYYTKNNNTYATVCSSIIS